MLIQFISPLEYKKLEKELYSPSLQLSALTIMYNIKLLYMIINRLKYSIFNKAAWDKQQMDPDLWNIDFSL